MRTTLLALLASLAMSFCPEPVSAKTRLAAGDASVEFPVGAPVRGIGDPNVKHRHGEPWVMLFLGTMDNVESGGEDGVDLLMTALRRAEIWSVDVPGAGTEGEAYWLAAMPFPRSLHVRLWAESCRPPEVRGFHCRPVKVGGAKGRDYVLWSIDPTQPGFRPYLVQRIVVRGDWLYLLVHSGAEDVSSPKSEEPGSASQKAFLNSLRFDRR